MFIYVCVCVSFCNLDLFDLIEHLLDIVYVSVVLYKCHKSKNN